MKKVLLLFLILGIFVSTIPVRVEAATNCHDTMLGCVDKQPDRCRDRAKCPAGAYQDTAYYLQIVLNIIKYVGVIACIAFTVIDFFKELLSEDKEGYKKVVNKGIKRLVYAVIIFVLPILVMELLKLLDIAGASTMYGIQ